MKTWSLNQTKQCANCSWKIGSSLPDIPGYDYQLHRQLAHTIVDDGTYDSDRPVRFMASHKSHSEQHLECIGWLNNQRNSNNLGLRLMMLSCSNTREIEVFGEQYLTFEETLNQ
jgi:hypothetical protein